MNEKPSTTPRFLKKYLRKDRDLILDLRNNQKAIYTNLKLEKSKEKPNFNLMEEYRQNIKTNIVSIIELANSKLSRDQENNHSVISSLKPKNYELESTDFEIILKNCFIIAIMELKNFPQELSPQQKNIVNSATTRDLNNLIRHIEFHFKFRDKYNTNSDIYQKLRSSDLEKF